MSPSSSAEGDCLVVMEMCKSSCELTVTGGHMRGKIAILISIEDSDIGREFYLFIHFIYFYSGTMRTNQLVVLKVSQS